MMARDGFRKGARFLSEVQLLRVWRAVAHNGGCTSIEDVIDAEVSIGRWFSPTELRAAILRHTDDEVKRGRRPSIICHDGIVYNNLPIDCADSLFLQTLKERIPTYAPYKQEEVKRRWAFMFDQESEGGEEE